MKNQLLDSSFHIRHKNKKIKEITNQTRREVRNETALTRSHKAHLKMLMSVINTLPLDEQASYSGIKAMLPDDSPRPKENTLAIFDSGINRTRSLPIEKVNKITEIYYKDHVEVQGYLYKLYVADAQTANDLAELQKYNIHALLTFGESNEPSKYTFLKGGYLCLPLEENSADLKLIMDRIIRFFDTYLAKGNVLVHCCQGNSRSCAAIIGYLIKKYRLSYEQALDVIKQGRPSVKITYLLERQLRRIERAELF